MKNREVLQLGQNLVQVANVIIKNSIRSGKLSYAIQRNVDNVDILRKTITKGFSMHEKTTEFNEKVSELYKKHASVKEESEEPVVFEERQNKNEAKIKSGIKKLETEYSEVIEHNKEVDSLFGEVLDEEVDFKVYKVKIENLDVPLTFEEIQMIRPIIDEA
jgi:hypothetical protein